MNAINVTVTDPEVSVVLDPNGVVDAYFSGLTPGAIIKWGGALPADSIIAESGSVATVTGTLNATSRIEATANSSSNSTGRFGDVEIQSFSADNNIIGSNTVFNGTQQYRQDGHVCAIQMLNGDILFRTAPEGTAGATVTLSTSLTLNESLANFAVPLNVTGTGTFSGAVTDGSANLIASSTNLTDGAAAATGTLTNAPTAGNPTKWIPIDDNGTTRYIPAW